MYIEHDPRNIRRDSCWRNTTSVSVSYVDAAADVWAIDNISITALRGWGTYSPCCAEPCHHYRAIWWELHHQEASLWRQAAWKGCPTASKDLLLSCTIHISTGAQCNIVIATFCIELSEGDCDPCCRRWCDDPLAIRIVCIMRWSIRHCATGSSEDPTAWRATSTWKRDLLHTQGMSITC